VPVSAATGAAGLQIQSEEKGETVSCQ